MRWHSRPSWGWWGAALLGCSGGTQSADGPGPSAASRATIHLDAADTVVAADLDGDGTDELVLIEGGVARWSGQEQPLGGVTGAVARGDVDGDGLEEALIATGMGRGQMEAPMRLWLLRAGGGTMAWEHRTERSQISDLRVVDGKIYLVYFVSDKQVQGGWLAADGVEPVHQGIMAMRQAPIPGGGLLVGRLYGDAPKSNGGLTWIAGGTETLLPTLRGVRSLAVRDLDGDGDVDAVVGDGWHSSYGHEADARIKLFEGPDLTRQRTLGFLEPDYSAEEIEVVGAGAGAGLLVTGSAEVHWLVRDGLGWADHRLGPVSETGNAVYARTSSGPVALISGKPARLVPLP